MRERKNIKKYIWLLILECISFCFFNSFPYFRKNKEEKDKKNSQLFDNWLVIIERGEKIETYFQKNNIKEIAVYGYGNIGRHLVTQLLDTSINIKYIIDKRKAVITGKIEKYSPKDNLPEVDAIIITPICDYNGIKDVLYDKISGKIISIEDIIYELL